MDTIKLDSETTDGIAGALRSMFEANTSDASDVEILTVGRLVD